MSIPDNITIYKNPSKESYWTDIYHLAVDVEKWFNTTNDYDIWRQGFGDDFSFYMAVDTNTDKAIGSASAVNYKKLDGTPLLTCNGMVCVDPAYRGQNIGLALSKLVMGPDAGFPNKSLIAVPAMSKKYDQLFGFGVIPDDNMTDIEFDVAAIDLSKDASVKGINIQHVEDKHWPKIYEFDRKLLPNTQRDAFLKLFCTQEDSYFKIAVNEESIEGFCLIRTNLKMQTLYTGPFYATSLELAQSLFIQTLKSIPNLSSFKRIRLAFYSSSKTPELIKELVKTTQEIAESKHFLQFTQLPVSIPGELVYSVTENDVSFI